MMQSAFVVWLLGSMFTTVPTVPQDAVSVSARIEADALKVGVEYEVRLDVRFKEAWGGDKSGVPAPLLQIQVPDSVQLTGKVLESYRDLAANEFLQEPFERLLTTNPVDIGFKLVKEPADDERLVLKVLTYAAPSSGGDVRFLRRHVALPLVPHGIGEVVEPTDSSWGRLPVLNIGDKAVPFSLPRADGSKVALDQFRGKKNVIVTTYRAFW